MRVKMVLDLVANTKGGAAQAKRDLQGVKGAAKGLDSARAGQRITRDFLNLSTSSKAATRGMKEAKAASTALGTNSGAAKLSRDMDHLARRTARARAEIAQLGTAEGKAAARTQAQARAARRKAESEGGGTSLFAGTRAMVGGYLGVQGARMAARATVGQSISFEKAMAEVKKKVDGMDDPAALATMEQSVSKWAIAYGRAREEVAALVAEAGAGGVALKDMPGFVRINLAAATAWDVSADKAGNALSKIRAATGWGNEQLELFVDKVNALSDAGAAKEMDVVEMFQRAGAAAKAAGVEFDTSLAFLTAMNNVAIAPEVAARGFNALSSNLRTATEQPARVEDGLKMLGLTPKGVEKGMKTNATATMIDVLERLEKHADKAKAAIKIFGKEWWDEIARAGQALPEIRKNLDIVRSPAKHVGSAQNSLNIELATTDKHLKRLSALASEVGDRLGRWALPGINEGIEKIIAGMDALDKRAADRKQAEELEGKVSNNQPLTPEEREKLANDRHLAARVRRGANATSSKRDFEATSSRMEGADGPTALSERAQLLRRQLERQIETLETELKLTPDGRGDRKKTRRLDNLRKQLKEIPTSPLDGRASSTDPRRPADQAERGQADRGEVMALRERVLQLESRLSTLAELQRTATNPADRRGFGADAEPLERRRNQADEQLRRKVAPNLTAAGRFGFGPGGAPVSAQPRGAGSGSRSFGLSVKDWAQSLIGAGDVDLGGAGITIAESLASGLRSGGASATSAASGIRDGITGAFSGADLTGAGTTMMASLEAGIIAGGPRAVAAAQRVAGQVKGALAGGGRQTLSGSLHDGVE
ncbi:phage tail tape measure protein [Bosea sp. 2KB_26]|uniref:phage tail tape measure protein n=1 Tax=Bosea sp. 2KB_26 TaxID=3237475 RepID=UPI003F917532